jgi:glycosyltransferase involved in cell wall biosynthesis
MRHIKRLPTRTGNKGTVIQNSKPKQEVVEQNKIVIKKIETPTPTINILTRTSNRPNSFKRCVESVKNQTYKKIRHIVSIDDVKDEEYVKSLGVEYIFIDKDKVSSEIDIPDPKTGKRFIFNLYFNILINKVEDGWILFLDDDDYLADNNAVQKMVNQIKNNTDLILWQMRYPNGMTLPSIQELGLPPKIARIGAPCFMVHQSIAKGIRWDGWKCGDFRFIQKVWAATTKKQIVKESLIHLGGVGLGLRNDQQQAINVSVQKEPMLNENQNILKQFQKKFESKVIDTADTQSITISGGISILITAYKTSAYIEQCLDSIESQTYFKGNNNFEVIVGVDGCTDTFKKLLTIKNKYRNLTIAMMEKNFGTYVVMNTLVPLTKYPNLIRFDSDDIMKPQMVSEIMKIDGKYDFIRFKFTPFEGSINNIVQQKIFPAVGVLFMKKSIFDKAGGYVNSKFSSDSELLIRLDKFTSTYFIENQLFYYRRHPNSLSQTVSKTERAKFDAKTNSNIYTAKNIKITPVVGVVKHVERSHIFNTEIHFFFERLKENNPFSIVRYGDGEMMIIEGKPIDLSNKHHGEHKFDLEDKRYLKLQQEMVESIQYKDANYFVGLPCPCCVNKDSVKKMLNVAAQPDYNLTWANIFVNSNHEYFKSYFLNSIRDKNVVVICHKNADTKELHKHVNVINEFRIGVNAWLNDYDKISEILEYSKSVSTNTVFLFMAGTFTKLAIYKIHNIRKDLFLLDIGSSLDKTMGLGVTRNYLKDNSENSKKICKWLTT